MSPPISLRDTEGEVAAPCYFCCCRYFLTPPSYGHLSYMADATPRNATGHGKGRG